MALYLSKNNLQSLHKFCKKWRLKQLAVFGSAVRDDFDLATSDVDLLYLFEPDVRWSLFDLIDMRDELKKILGRKVDFVSKEVIKNSPNPYRKQAILSEHKVIYDSAAWK